MDYSKTLINIMKSLPVWNNLLEECIVDEAINIPTEIKYDSVICPGVFPYFPDYDYATTVIDKMLEKSNRNIAVLRCFDKDVEEEYFKMKRATVENYDEKYKGLSRLFFKKQFFIDYAKRHDLRVEISNYKMENYWNAPYIFDCFMYK